MAARHAAALALLAVSACGDTLVDHRAVDLLRPPGGASVCDPAACPDPDPAWTGAVAACLGPPGADTCGYACTGGYLRCSAGCCPVAKVAAGAAHTCAITTGGALYCWGSNASRQVSEAAASGVVPTPLEHAHGGVTAVSLGAAHTCAIASGGIACWGDDSSGQAPAAVSVPGAVALALGAAFSCALDAAGAVRCWGSNAFGQRGGDASPVATPIAAGATAIAAGAEHACALVSGEVRCWGRNASGQLGVPAAGASTATPTPVLAGIAALGAGESLGCAAAAIPSGGAIDDSLRCWGAGLGPLLGADPATAPAIPLKDASQSVVRFEVDAVAVGRAHVCVKRDGLAETVKCFGSDGSWGQLGGQLLSPPEALTVPGTQGAQGFAAGADHACAITSSGGVICWGRNSSGQLGDGTQVTPGLGGDARVIGTPVEVSGR